MSSFELDGFAQYPEDIDGTLEDLNAYNYCLALDYYCAIKAEDFDSLGEVLNDEYAYHEIINRVCDWLNYNSIIGKNYEKYFDKLYGGTIITYKKRTFIEACYEHGWTNLADSLSSRLEKKGIVLKK